MLLSYTDIILETIKQKLSCQPHFELVSNRMIFDSEGIVQGFSEPVIHSINKGSTGIAKFEHISEKLKVRIVIFFAQFFIFHVIGKT